MIWEKVFFRIKIHKITGKKGAFFAEDFVFEKPFFLKKTAHIYILRRFKICSSVKFGSGTPFEIFIACVVSIFHCRTEGPCMEPCLSTGLLVR